MSFLYSSAAAEDSAVASDAEAVVDEIIVTNVSASKRYIHIFDLAALPIDTTAPDICIAIPTATTVSWDCEGTESGGLKGETFYAGVVVALSSTAATLTVTVASEAVITVRGKAT